jgi:hypothetical protein
MARVLRVKEFYFPFKGRLLPVVSQSRVISSMFSELVKSAKTLKFVVELGGNTIQDDAIFDPSVQYGIALIAERMRVEVQAKDDLDVCFMSIISVKGRSHFSLRRLIAQSAWQTTRTPDYLNE